MQIIFKFLCLCHLMNQCTVYFIRERFHFLLVSTSFKKVHLSLSSLLGCYPLFLISNFYYYYLFSGYKFLGLILHQSKMHIYYPHHSCYSVIYLCIILYNSANYTSSRDSAATPRAISLLRKFSISTWCAQESAMRICSASSSHTIWSNGIWPTSVNTHTLQP